MEKFIGHEFHKRVDMLEEHLVARTEIVEPFLAVRSADEPVLGAFTVARKADRALPAVLRQCIVLVSSELPLLLGVCERRQRLLHDVAQLVLREIGRAHV